MKEEIYEEAYYLLKKIYGANAMFRTHQYEAIESVFTHRRTLIVEKTGWGKSLVYFLACKMLRKRAYKATVVISPLLALMDNQKEAAEKIGLKCAILNSKSNKAEIINNWQKDYYDLIFITPETLFKINTEDLQIGFLVIDEVHCISDYGHDFRLEYMRLKEIINRLPKSVPILGVTATATNRVINDLKNQLGEDIFILRGPLMRESLNIEVINMNDVANKYSFILTNVSQMPGTGIIYCLTTHDCDDLAAFLIKNGVNVLPYHSKLPVEEEQKAIDMFKNNKIKALVSTIKLGMGYDKDDISFIIHFQIAQNIVTYYQQIGRAGRQLANAYIFLLSSQKDNKIIDYFIDSAFPKKEEQDRIYEIIAHNNGVKLSDIRSKCNYRNNRIDKALTFLENDKFIYNENKKYYSTAVKYYYNEQHYEDIKKIRRKELLEMQEFINTLECYNKYLANALDDYTALECGKCSNCLNKDIYPLQYDPNNLKKAQDFIYNRIHWIKPRKKKEDGSNLEFINEEGICLSYYGDYGYGQMIEYDKYHALEYRQEIIDRCQDIIKKYLVDKYNIKYITCVPSNRNQKMENLTQKIAQLLNLTYIKTLTKESCPNQKEMENSYFQSLNAKNNYKVLTNLPNIDKIILVDDIVDSKWTLTWCGYYLRQKGVKEVYPFTISDSSNRSDINE